MITLTKVNGEPKPLKAIRAHWDEWQYKIQRDTWEIERAAEHIALYPQTIDGEPIYDIDGVTITGYEQIPNPDYVEYDIWIAAQAEFEQVATVDTDFDAFLVNSPEWKAIQKKKIDSAIDVLTVTTSTGKIFDANVIARQNMADGILASGYAGITETPWRLADNTDVLVTLEELKEAHLLALQAYAAAKSIGG